MSEVLEKKGKASRHDVLAHLETMLVPAGLKIEDLLKKLPEAIQAKWGQERKIKGLYGIVNAICYGQAIKKLPPHYYVNIHNRDLRVIVGRVRGQECLYREALEILSALGVIEVNARYGFCLRGCSGLSLPASAFGGITIKRRG